ncbi:uncharacterized protein PADG_05438 [Paracoccidioides brasiliensis Pb18]|uniref:Uncharacterized protein n=1 Tax=Paracoccidioides brasiliensis (strain Pb18) TaxID=502780 RepID=C1GDV2_PARBD|nr:uncharacterized protein PADG_05438 [Paracoccidioides brasiliensis Pb18]EEH49359.2 hypothetical protein PADG_05438 [Paracoccidioides brasiliensis Pb18]
MLEPCTHTPLQAVLAEINPWILFRFLGLFACSLSGDVTRKHLGEWNEAKSAWSRAPVEARFSLRFGPLEIQIEFGANICEEISNQEIVGGIERAALWSVAILYYISERLEIRLSTLYPGSGEGGS